MSSGVLRVGFIGCGALGRVHAARMRAMGDIEISAAADPSAESVSAFSAENPGAKCFHDFRDCLRQEPLDAVVISSPNSSHVEQLLASLESGAHVLCEKPLTFIPAEVNAVAQAARASGKIVSVAYQSRYRTTSRALKRELDSHRWGRITAISIYSGEDWLTPNRGTWRHDPSVCPGGFFGDANGHQIDLTCWLGGLQPVEVRASMHNAGTPVPIVTWGTAQLSAAGSEPVPMSYMFMGAARTWREEITINTEGADWVLRDCRLFHSAGGGPIAPYDCANTVDETPDHAFIQAVRGGAPVITAPDTVWPVLQFTLAGLESAQSGHAVAVSAQTVK